MSRVAMLRPVVGDGKGEVMATIYLHESGYTGEDLIQRDQSAFVICTHSIDERPPRRSRHLTPPP
jgi:hypothetical protein